ncbi:Uu.00g079520.m01.CDS01 [Anthostomella pinea]|uniref:Uu.00g079520.m01.CDS01 n=1 Tax=Anthostomella pinea TaxID=933095 RepID=A0AAI8YJ45_9PEZI|nr:Uu.00g079520.m01.CDS01 [Anthostomella pinea]
MIASPVLALVAAGLAVANSPDHHKSFRPKLESARENGPQIFNAIHNAMREFGSALNHNGMSLFPALIPEGVLLYHGTHTRDVPHAFEWLAFEIEHAQQFALPMPPRRPPPRVSHEEEQIWHSIHDHDPLELHLAARELGRPPRGRPDPSESGHLHLYQATRELRVLYIDGMAAGKTDMGTIDTQDYLLTGNQGERHSMNDWARAEDLCKLAKPWRIDGFIRMEPGFEVIYCDFTEGLRLVSTHQQPEMNDPGSLVDADASEAGWGGLMTFAWARAAAQRYHDIGASRVMLDYSSMVSAYFYPANLTNPKPDRPELPRLTNSKDWELQIMREHIGYTTLRSRGTAERRVGWQGVVDMIVSRYANRFPLMARTASLDVFKYEVNNLLNVFIDYSEDDKGLEAAKRRCIGFYLQPASPQTPEDFLIQAAIESTTTAICTALFEARRLVVEDTDADKSSLNAGKDIVRELMDVLSWSTWKECGACQSDEVCFIAMWPFGNVEDHFHPSCLNHSTIHGRMTYWRNGRPGPRPPPDERQYEVGEL